MNTFRTHYDSLQVSETASPEVIRGAYRYLSQKWHPDKNPDNQEEAERISRLINEAYAVLSDAKRRKEHDEWIRKERERTAKPQSHDRVPPTSAPPATTAIQTQENLSFFKRSWLMVLFTLALVMVLGVLPYQAFLGEFKFGYLAWGLFCLGAGRYAYVRLYHPETVAEEKREESNRQRREAAPRKKRRKLDGLYFSAHGLYQLQQ